MCSAFCLPAVAQKRLLDREPFDRVILKPGYGGDVIEVSPVQLPQRPAKTLPTEGRLQLNLIERPGESYDVAWYQVAEVRVYEQILIEEAQKLTADDQFDEAFEYLSRVLTVYPNFPGANDAINTFLRRNALLLHQSQQEERALALLLTLYERSPADPALPNAVEVVAGEIIQSHLRSQNYVAARGVLDLWQSRFRDIAKAAAQAWQARFEAAAERQVSEARRLIDEKQYVEARKAAHRSVAIWPKFTAAGEMLARIQREFPSVTVGVFETAPRQPTPRIDSWPALRTSRLTTPQLAELVGFGAEGGEYRSPFGELSVDESGRVMRLRLDSRESEISADELARYLMNMAVPGNSLYRQEMHDALSSVSIAAGNTIELHLKRPHVRPEVLLQTPPPHKPSTGPRTAAPGARFDVTEYLPTEVFFSARKNPSSAPTTRGNRLEAVAELAMPDDDVAVRALTAGEIDVLDHVPPWQLARLRATAGIRVVPYRLPTVHVLLANPKCELASRREFRRALCYGIDRSWIVQRVLLGGATLPGFEVVSGPFPAGTSIGDAIRYGYNNQIAPRPFEPRLAAILAAVAAKEIQKAPAEDANGKEADIVPQLVLAHPTDPLARVACQLIQAQLNREGISLELRQFTAEELATGQVEYDLRYAELGVWEPLADARRLLGPAGFGGGELSAPMRAALAQLNEATTWNDVRARLAELHEIAHQEMPVIPLWQTVNFCAIRESVVGVGESPVSLYQNLDDWRLAPGRGVASAGSN